MKRAALLLGVLYFLSTIQGLIPLVDYEINYDYYAEVLCENKTEPELHCDGKCQLLDGIEDEMKTSKEQGVEVQIPIIIAIVGDLSEFDFSNNYLNTIHYSVWNDHKRSSIPIEVSVPPPLV